MEKIVKIVYLTNRQTLISEIEEVGADVGEPDCRLINAQVVGEDLGLEALFARCHNARHFHDQF